jgi:hypothetical protein
VVEDVPEVDDELVVVPPVVVPVPVDVVLPPELLTVPDDVLAVVEPPVEVLAPVAVLKGGGMDLLQAPIDSVVRVKSAAPNRWTRILSSPQV